MYFLPEISNDRVAISPLMYDAGQCQQNKYSSDEDGSLVLTEIMFVNLSRSVLRVNCQLQTDHTANY